MQLKPSRSNLCCFGKLWFKFCNLKTLRRDHTVLGPAQLTSGLGFSKIMREFLFTILAGVEIDFCCCLLKLTDKTWCKFVLKLSKVHHLHFKWTSSFPQSGTESQSESLEDAASLGGPDHLPGLRACANILDDLDHLVSVREAPRLKFAVNQLVLHLHFKRSPPAHFPLDHCIYNPVTVSAYQYDIYTYWESSPVSSTGGPSRGWRSLRSHSILCALKSTSFLLSQRISLPSGLVGCCCDCDWLFLVEEFMATWTMDPAISLRQMISPTLHLNQEFDQSSYISYI